MPETFPYISRKSSKIMRIVCLLFLSLLFSINISAQADLVNPLMGTDSEFKLSNGNTYPSISLPWGLHAWTAQTGKMGDGWTYGYDATHIRGIKLTHQPSPWINDYGAFSLMAVTGKMKWKEEDRLSWFSHKAETVHPWYYKVYLADYDTWVELAPTERAAVLRFTFPETADAYVILDAYFRGSAVKIDPAAKTVSGYAANHNGGVPANFRNYFMAQFDQPFTATYSWKDSILQENRLEISGEHTGAVLKFDATRGKKQVVVKIGASFISQEQAALNLKRELGAQTFDDIAAAGKQRWETELGRIKISGGTLDQQRTFYSCLYRVLLFPRKFYEYDAQNQLVHYSPYNGKVLPGYMFTDNGFWDTFRAVFPFFTFMYPEMDGHIMEGLVNAYKESGWLPEWASPGHRDCMIGSNSASLIADAYLKGIRGYDIEALYEAIRKNAGGRHPDITSVGRYGAEYYNRLGYIPYNVDIRENTARTLEYAYADFCGLQLAKALQKPAAEIAEWEKRSQNYRNVFDPVTGWMRGRNEDGSFQSPFNPYKWGDAFTEGNSLHYTWSVFHDINGLIDLMGGREKFAERLDTIFAMPPLFDDSYYGFPIHEIREMQIMGLGNYAHGNQPIQHLIYLYGFAGQPWKTQARIREVMSKLYNYAPDGYCGDEDNGQTSAWYVFSALGFYPVCPGSNQYVLGTPLFDKAEIQLPNGKSLVIEARNNGNNQPYIKSFKLNGKPTSRNWISHEELMNGGWWIFDMADQPNYDRGNQAWEVPFSMKQ